MSWNFVGQLVNRSGKYIRSVPVSAPNLCLSNVSKLCGLSTSSFTLHDKKEKDDLGHTTILSQSGTVFHELPVIVRKAKLSSVLSTDDTGGGSNHLLARHDSDEEDSSEVMYSVKKCRSMKHLLDLLLTVHDEEVSPVVAVEALRKLIELENNQHYRRRNPTNGSQEDKDRNSARDIFVSRLLDIIVPSQDPKLILDALKIITRDMTRAASRFNNAWVSHYRLKLSQEALILATDSKFSISQLCEVVHAFAYIEKAESEYVDMLWVGFEGRAKEIDETNIVDVFRVLPILKKSRRVVLSVVESAFMHVCWHITGTAMAEIMTTLQEGKIPSLRILAEISHWISLNIISLKEEDLTDIVAALSGLDYTSPQIVQSLEKYVKSHKKINPELLASIMEFCSKFRLRSSTILETCASHTIDDCVNMTPIVLKSIFAPFGLLHYHPEESSTFLNAVENSFSENFARFRPEDATDIVLAFVFLQHYPVKFITRIFSSHFLDRLESIQDIDAVRAVHTKLKIFDMAMTLDCKDYGGPLLPRESNVRSLWIDARLRRIVNHIKEPLENVVGNLGIVSQFVLLSDMPAVSLYIVDILFHPHLESPFKAGRLSLSPADRSSSVGFFIHVPEHFCAQMQHLTGPQVLRHRHFQKNGLRTVKLRYDVLVRLRLNPKSLKRYLQECYKSAVKEQIQL